MAFGAALSIPNPGVGCAAAAVLLLSGYARATIAYPTPDAAQPLDSLEEVVVTARKRTENLQDTPIAMSVFTAADLGRQSIDNLQAVAERTANLRSTVGPQGGSSSHYFIRGIGQLDFIASTDPGVGTYLDGVYLGRTTGAALELLDIERVEILRGPQGTLYGRNTIGGAINVITSAPASEPKRNISLTVGSRNRYEGRLALGGQVLKDTLFADFALLAKSQSGWQRRLTDGGHFGDEETYAARAALKWQTNGRMTVLASLDATHSRGTADPHLLAAANPARGGRPEFVVNNPGLTWAGQRSPDDLDVSGTAITVDYKFDQISLKSISAYRQLDSSTGIDFDGTPFADLDQLVFTKQSQWSQELQLSSQALESRLKWLLGLYAFGEQVRQDIPVILYGTRIAENNDLRNDSFAVFTHITWSLTDRWSASGGVRYSYESKEHAFDHFIDDSATHIPLFAPTTLHDQWNSNTPKVGLEFRAMRDLLLYTSLSQGFRSGGFNGRPVGTDGFLSYGPETLTTYEAGLKSEWLDRRLRLNAASYYSRYRDIQLTRTTIGAGGAPIVVTGNAGNAELYGFELDLTAAPTERLLISTSAGNLHNRYTSLAPGAAVDASDRLPVSPRWTLASSAEYSWPVADLGRLRGRIDYSYTSRFNYFFDNPSLSWQEGYSLWNVRLEFEPGGASWQVAAFVLNATDKQHSVFREDVRESFGTAIEWPARPREWGLEIKYRF